MSKKRKPRYDKGKHFQEVGRKNYFQRYYLTEKEMIFQTLIYGKEAKIIRNSDGAILAELRKDGTLIVYPGYRWDGPSGPTVDTIAFIIGSLPHDVLYQMLRESLILEIDKMRPAHMPPAESMIEEFHCLRKLADKTMKQENYLNGMTRFRAWYTYQAVRGFGKKSALPPILKEVA